VVNVGGGIMFSYDAKALEGWSEFVFHTEPGSILPSLNSGSETMAHVYYNGGVYSDDFEDAVDAVSAVFMHDTIMNEYNTLSAYGGRSEWVMTFPTKRFYTQGSAKAPFTDYFRDHADPDTIADGACEIIKFGPGEKGIWDREEQTTPDIIIPGSGPGFSPPPPGEEPPEDPVAVACSEVTVVRFGDSSDFSGSTELFGAETNVLLVDNEGTWGFNEGWLQLNLLDADNPNTQIDEGERWLPNEEGQDSFGGLPVVGFWAFAVKNENVTEGVLANYSGLFGHKSTRLVSTAALPEPQ